MKKLTKTLEFTTFSEMLEVLNSETKCREYLENIIWNGEPVCPHCESKSKNHYKLTKKGEFKGLYKCKDCRERFTITVKTMFEGSHIPLRKWFIAIYIFNSHKKGVSSIQLGKDLGLTQKTSWFMLNRIRNTFSNKSIKKSSGTFQADESFFGGKNKNRHENKKVKESQGRSVKDKTPVFGMIKNSNEVFTSVVPNTKAKTLKPIIEKMVEKGSIIISDEWKGYNGLSKDFSHIVINHKENEYCKNGFSNNGIENFWSMMKRGIYGIYHQTSPKHLHRYCDEFAHRYNTRELRDNDRFNISLKNSENQLSYQELIAK
jgi:transposase-like protein